MERVMKRKRDENSKHEEHEHPTRFRRSEERARKLFSPTLENPLSIPKIPTESPWWSWTGKIPKSSQIFFNNAGTVPTLDIVKHIAEQLSQGYIPLIEMVIEQDYIPQLVQFLRNDDVQFQMYGAWSINNIAAGLPEHTRVVEENGAIPLLVALLGSENGIVQIQATAALGNVAADYPVGTETVVKSGALEPLLSLMMNGSEENKEVACLTVSKLDRAFFPLFPPDKILPAVPALKRLLSLKTSDRFLITALKVLKGLTKHLPREIGTTVAEANIYDKLLPFINPDSFLNREKEVTTLALQCLGRIAFYNEYDIHIQRLIDQGLFKILRSRILINRGDKYIHQAACALIANIIANRGDQLKVIVKEGLITVIVQLMKDGEAIFQVEAARLLVQASATDIELLPCKECIKALCDLLNSEEIQLLKFSLEGLHNFLLKGKDWDNMYGEIVKDCGGHDKVIMLMKNKIEDIAVGATAVGYILGIVD